MNDVAGMLARIFAEESSERALAVDATVDWPAAFTPAAGAQLSRGLEVVLRLDESPVVRESVLHALAELAAWDLVPQDVLERVGPDASLTGPGLDGYVESLREGIRFSGPPESAAPPAAPSRTHAPGPPAGSGPAPA